MLQFTGAAVAAASVAGFGVSWSVGKQFPIPIIYWKIDYYIENNFLLVKWTTIR